MSNLNAVLKQEISRLARKEIKSQSGPQQKSFGKYRGEIATLKKQIADLSSRLKSLEKGSRRKPAAVATGGEESGSKPRFSPGWVKKHREKLGISAADYGKLAGVSGLTIYNWEKGSSSPRTKQLLSWGNIRTLGKREAVKMLEAMDSQ